MRHLQRAVWAVALLLSGGVLSQAFLNADFPLIGRVAPSDLEREAVRVLDTYQDRAVVAPNEAVVAQLTTEASLRLQYIQVRQNAELIRLMGVLASKK